MTKSTYIEKIDKIGNDLCYAMNALTDTLREYLNSEKHIETNEDSHAVNIDSQEAHHIETMVAIVKDCIEKIEYYSRYLPFKDMIAEDLANVEKAKGFLAMLDLENNLRLGHVKPSENNSK